MEKKKMGNGKRNILWFIMHLLAGLIVAASVSIGIYAYIEEEGNDQYYSYMLMPWDVREDFTDTIIFEDIFRAGIRDISKIAVIKNQMEVNGSYEAKKKIDIIAFANRKNGYIDTEGDEKRIYYYLEDLIKWGNYGFSISTQEVPSNSEAAFFGTDVMTKGTHTFTSKKQEEVAVLTEDVIVEIQEENELEYRDILYERYQTIEGKSLKEYAATWEEYEKLIEALRVATSDLSYNFSVYKNFDNFYGKGKTNISYCYEVGEGDNKSYIGNIGPVYQENGEPKDAELYTKYLYYSPADFEFKTNTNISEYQIRDFLSDYEYAFPEDTGIWIGVNTDFPVNDIFKSAMSKYNNFMPYYWMFTIGIVLFTISYLSILIVLTVFEGRNRSYELKIIDKLPLEILSLFIMGALGLVGFAIFLVVEYCYFSKITTNSVVILLSGAIGVIISVVFVLFYLTLVRRFKAHSFWKTTLVGKCYYWMNGKLRKGCHKLKSGLIVMHNNPDLLIRIILPFSIFILLNIILCITILGIIPALILDVGVAWFLLKEAKSRQIIVSGIEEIRDGNLGFQLDTKGMFGDNLILANSVNTIGEGIRSAVEKSMKDERLKADLITNVSHDIKTPLTSIINYVDLLKRENIQEEKVAGYIDVLDMKSQRLKQLTEDLVEASKISSGNIVYEFEKLDFVQLIHQTLGEFSEKFEDKNLEIVRKLPEHPVYIHADSRRVWRIMENIFSNINKYALQGTRVYLDMELKFTKTEDLVMKQMGKSGVELSADHVELSIKNISAQPLNIHADELTERFIRGDVSRNTEGSGLGLSIAKNLTEAQRGNFVIYLDGDLFKVVISFPVSI